MVGHLATVWLLAGLALSAPIIDSRASSPLTNITASSAAAGSGSGGTASDYDLITKLITAPTALDRLNLLPNDEDFVFDFASPPANATSSGKAGHIVRSNQLTFPALVGQSAAMTVGYLGPCGFNTPHTHPRSSELNLVIEGTLYTQVMTENNARVVTNKLQQYQMTVFPKGALHTEFNPTCQNATFVASFADSDPGTQQAAQTLFSLSEDLVSATFGEVIDGAEVANYASVLPSPVAKGVEACLAQCGISRK